MKGIDFALKISEKLGNSDSKSETHESTTLEDKVVDV
jgi:hypothetical protein